MRLNHIYAIVGIFRNPNIMSSILFSRGVNSQGGNPLHTEINRLNARIAALEKKLLELGPGAVGPAGPAGPKGSVGCRSRHPFPVKMQN